MSGGQTPYQGSEIPWSGAKELSDTAAGAAGAGTGGTYPVYPDYPDTLPVREKGGSSPLLWRLLIWGVALVVALHYGLFHAMLTSVSGFVDMGALIGGTLFLVSKKGFAFSKVIAILGVAWIALMMILTQMLGMKSAPQPANAQHPTVHQSH